MSRADYDRWEEKYKGGWRPAEEPSDFVRSCADLLPADGRALDVAGGNGRHALWLAQQGLDVTLLDISPTALGMARERAAAAGLALHTLQADLEADGPPAGPWDVVLTTFFLWLPLFGRLPELLAPGGLFIAEHPTLRSLERNDKPGPAYLLREGELQELVLASGALEVVRYQEGWNPQQRHTARVVARRRAEARTGV